MNTIVDHVCYLVEKKVLNKKEIDKMIDKNTKKRIIKSIKKVGADKLKPIFEDLNEEIDYDKIKLVLSSMTK